MIYGLNFGGPAIPDIPRSGTWYGIYEY